MQYQTLTEALLAAPRDREFVTTYRDEDDVTTTTFGQFIDDARWQAAQFVLDGLRPGDPVILIMPQGIPLMVSFAAAMLVGAIPTILAYPNFKIEPSKYRFGLAGVSKNLKARLVVLDEAFPEELFDHIAIEDAKIIRSAERKKETGAVDLPRQTASGNQVAFIQHSAGTTGLQKGVALSHSCVLTQLGHLADTLRLNDEDRIYSWLPLYHDMGLIACFMLPLAFHLPVVMQSPTDWVVQPGSMPYLIGQYRCTLSWVPNFAYQFLARRLSAERRAEFDLSSLRMVINCSEPVRAQSMDEFYAAYAGSGLRLNALQSSYAMAENVFAVTQSGGPGGVEENARIWLSSRALIDRHIAEPVSRDQSGAICLVSSGKCLPGNRINIVDEKGQDLPDGHVGEILIQSDSLFDGYHNRPDLTAKALKNGWYYSGDLGLRMDDEIYIIGRKTDLIIVAGKNIHPHDVEQIASAHPDIHDGRVVAFGLFNPDLGTQDIVVVVEVQDEKELVNASSIEHAIRNAVVAELGVAVRAVYVRPPKWIIKSTAGKPARSTSRQKLLQEQPELPRVEM